MAKKITLKDKFKEALDLHLGGCLTLTNLSEARELVEKDQNKYSKEIEKVITKAITKRASVEFKQMLAQEMPRNTPHRDWNECDTFFEYLTTVILCRFTRSDINQVHFAFPGTYPEGEILAKKFIGDLDKIVNELGISYHELPSIKYGYAITFVK